MNLEVICKSCFKETSFKESVMSRSELEDKLGAQFNHRCTKCGVVKSYHVNQVKATNSSALKFFGTVIGLAIMVGVTIYFFLTGILTNIGLIIGGAILAGSQIAGRTSNASAFNQYKIDTRDYSKKE